MISGASSPRVSLARTSPRTQYCCPRFLGSTWEIRCPWEIRCRFIFSGKNDELTPDFIFSGKNDELTPDFRMMN